MRIIITEGLVFSQHSHIVVGLEKVNIKGHCQKKINLDTKLFCKRPITKSSQGNIKSLS
jgi:hypothetical protein